jgi:hypothetical protein
MPKVKQLRSTDTYEECAGLFEDGSFAVPCFLSMRFNIFLHVPLTSHIPFYPNCP